MPDNIGDMFYTGEMPWHGKGLCLAGPATLKEALKAGGLNWRVGEVDLLTTDTPSSPAPMRKAIVRLDRPAGHPDRVLGVVHRGFVPLQNEDGAVLFDAIFGAGKAVYHTGGYIERGQLLWLLAAIDRPREIARNDIVQPYALFANSHDGSMAFHIKLTTVRVVCQNTLALALRDPQSGRAFRRSHQGSFRKHAEAAQQFFAAAISELNATTDNFIRLSTKRCSNEMFEEILGALLREPRKPRSTIENPGILKAWEARVHRIKKAREKVRELRESGRGMDLEGAKGTFWGVLNAVLEFVDHHEETNASRISYALLGDGMDFKAAAFKEILKRAA